MDFKINQERMNINTDVMNMNRHKLQAGAYSVMGSIREINIKEYTCTVFVPSAGILLHEVMIANAAISDAGVGLNMPPSVGQKCIILISSQHKPVLVTTIANSFRENNNKVLLGEYKLGDDTSFIKRNLIGDLLIKTESSITINSKNGISNYTANNKLSDSSYLIETKRENGISSSKEMYYKSIFTKKLKSKSDLLIDGNLNLKVAEEVLDNLDKTIERVSIFLSKVEGINSLAMEEGIDAIELLRTDLLVDDVDKSTFLCVEKGDTVENLKEDNILSFKYVESSKNKFSIKCKKNGCIDIDCENITINKRGTLRDE